jgi:hypothetical protein
MVTGMCGLLDESGSDSSNSLYKYLQIISKTFAMIYFIIGFDAKKRAFG